MRRFNRYSQNWGIDYKCEKRRFPVSTCLATISNPFGFSAVKQGLILLQDAEKTRENVRKRKKTQENAKEKTHESANEIARKKTQTKNA
jgi:hypothetical protein